MYHRVVKSSEWKADESILPSYVGRDMRSSMHSKGGYFSCLNDQVMKSYISHCIAVFIRNIWYLDPMPDSQDTGAVWSLAFI